jgi:hypothetical protein
MILIDAIYVNSGGGRILLDYFLKEFSKCGIQYSVLCDRRLYLTGFFNCKINKEKLFVIKNGELSRYLFYFSKHHSFHSIFCFASIPPPFKIKDKKVTIFFHNLYRLNNFSNLYYLDFFKNLYTRFISYSKYEWVVQSNKSRLLLSEHNSVNLSLIKVFPFFEPLEKVEIVSKVNCLRYSYIADSSIHKNHLFLIRNWMQFYDINCSIFSLELNITLKLESCSGELFDLLSDDIFLQKYNIVNHGPLKYPDVIKLLKITDYLVYVSNFESFGLPLIEACQLGCKIIAPDLEYVSEVVNPSFIFKANDNCDFLIKLNQSCQIGIVSESSLVTSNLINPLIDYLSDV